MTSIPASRSARAMILAPRSWPSRPGLATTTRIVLAVAAPLADAGQPSGLEGGALGVGAQDLLHRRDHLALGGAGARGFDNRRHQVLLGGGDPLQLGERRLHRGSVAAGAGPLQAVDLLAF